MAGIAAIKRKGFKGGGMDASTKSFDAPAAKRENRKAIGREDRISHGATQFQADNQGFTKTGPGRYRGGDDPTPTKKVRDEQKFKYNKQFYDVGEIGPSHSRKSAIQKHNLKKRLAYRERLMKNILKKQRGANVDNALGIEAYGPNGTGLYSQEFIDSVLSGERQPPNFFTKVDATGGLYSQGLAAVANFIGPKMAGPVTEQKIDQLLNQQTMLENFDPEKTTVKQMMEKYEPNRFKTIYGDGQPDGDAYSQILPIDYNTGAGLPVNDVADETTFDYRFGTGQNVGRDVTLGYAANGGRITRADGGIMNAVPRQAYGLGDIVKSITKPFKGIAKAAGKVLKSDVGKMALLAGGYYYGGGSLPFIGARTGSTGFGTTGIFSGLRDKVQGSDFLSKMLLNKKDNFSPFKVGALALTAAPFLGIGTKAKQDDSIISDRGGRLKDSQGNEVLPSGIRDEINQAYKSGDAGRIEEIENYYAFLPPINQYLPYPTYGAANGGRIGKAEGGLMNLGGMEKDYRAEGGFVPIGKEEKADDVPARLSVNEFVFTADAVRNAGGGDIDRGAEVMENMMKNLENGGTVSEESQGNAGAQGMFSVSERIGEVI